MAGVDGASGLDGALGGLDSEARCPCGSGDSYGACCGRPHCAFALRGELIAGTAEQLMRSRYSAFAVQDTGYLLATWHPDHRPATVDVDPDLRWVRLDVLDVVRGGPFDQDGEVEFEARYRLGVERGTLHERSRFARVDGRWLYLDGTAG